MNDCCKKALEEVANKISKLSEDDPAFYWERMFKNLARENARLMERLVKLEDQLRWRNAHTEPPTLKADI